MLSISAAVWAAACLVSVFIETVHAQPTQADYNYWDYGRSEPVYPSPQGQGLGSWAQPYTQARALVSQMTTLEKQNISTGFSNPFDGCVGSSGGVSRLGYPGMCLQDAGNGVRGPEGSSGYSSGIHVGATWNRALTNARGFYMGAEFKAKGVNMALGPVVGPIGRVTEGGRNWEGFTNDPYLSGELVYESVTAMQKNVIACTKHFIGNEQETNRNPTSLAQGGNASVSSNIDDQTMHELYLWPFQSAVRAGSGAIMCSYQRINNSYGCQNSKTQNGLLKTELGFEGLITTDWGAMHSGVGSALAGLDMVMPNANFWANLSMAVTNGSVPQARLDDMATRILATWYKFAPLPNPGFGMPKSASIPHVFVNARDPASAPTLYQSAVEGHVLVKNTGSLPIVKPKFISLFGYDAIATPQNNVGGVFGNTNSANESQYNGYMWTAGGSGASTPAYIDSPFNAFTNQARADHTTWLSWDFVSNNPFVDQGSEMCVVFVNEYATEGRDRPGLADPTSDTLINNVASKCNNTVIVISNAGIRLVDTFYDNPNVTAIVYAHLPGQDGGTALVDLLYGRQGFSGRLPYTVAKQATDYGSLLGPTVPDATSNYFTQSNFTEGVYIDYKAFIRSNIAPRFAFGFGLTYTNFTYSGLTTTLAPTNATSLGGIFPRLAPAAQIVEGGNPHLFDVLATVSVTITNTGAVAGAEVPQLYVGIPNGPAKQLRGFAKPTLQPGASAMVSFPLTRRDLSRWNVVLQDWELQSASYPIYVGASVLDVRLSGQLSIASR